MLPSLCPNALFFTGAVVLPDKILRDGAVLCRDGRIQAVGRSSDITVPRGAIIIDVEDGYISPGFVDLHVHGGDGADFMDATEESVRKVISSHARHGTTTLFPTSTTGSREQIEAMLGACRDVRDSWVPESGARIAGVHYYGPYFAPEKVGCHSPKGCRAPDPSEYLHAFGLDIIKIATCAAELPGAEDFYREASRRGYFVTCGHSNSTWEEMQRGFELGLRHVDHFWCVMSTVDSLKARFGTPMRAGMEQFVLANWEMSTEVIADGCHLSPTLLAFAYRMKGPRRLCLVTDSSRAMDMPPGDYRFGSQEDGPIFRSDGEVGFVPDEGRRRLASSIAGMDRMVRNMQAATGASVESVIRMASLTPAERAGIANDVGSLAQNKFADVLILSRELRVQRVFVAGVEAPIP
ncbi:N-acetylglucosamine-6-phosphate deacetylase [Planctomycetes bacterium Pan216]|uniref:N-acetylglucosamine-6-phosphate deacetylase n=1 Tax=Kolteria novifilia TaxID=2527975 RepID=A0A518B4A4_9BACT|nr:N-acetylglucosamine-6-phosphate deacetylase [Planctomycetes bacterium Pan216]